MNKHFVVGLIALAAFLPVVLPASEVHAQQSASTAAAVRIDGFDVEPVERAAPGSELEFTLYGSPGGRAVVQIGGASGGVVLEETEAGVYEGSYTIRSRDRITAESVATANLRVGNKVVSFILDEPLLRTASIMRVPPAVVATVPKIDRFDIDPPARLAAGEDLILSLSGTPGGAASARIAGVKGKIVLDELSAGRYEGTYTIKNRDRIAANAVVTGNLKIDNRETSAVLGQSLVSGTHSQSRVQRAAVMCLNCGTVEAINVVEVKGQGSYLGKIAGGVAGALLGSQVGRGNGTTVAQVAGAAGGAYAGNEIEKRMKTTKHYEVIVRLENGGSQSVSYVTQPDLPVGAKVKVTDGVLTVRQ